MLPPDPEARLRELLVIIEKIRGYMPPENMSFLDTDLLDAYELRVQEAANHPKSAILAEYFLRPEKLAPNLHQDIESHLAGCEKCKEVAAYYRTHKDLFALWKEEPCD